MAENEDSLRMMIMLGQLILPPAGMCLVMGARASRSLVCGAAKRGAGAVGDRANGHGRRGIVGDRDRLGADHDTFKALDVTDEFRSRSDLKDLGRLCRKMGIGFHILEDKKSGKLGIEYTARNAETLEFALGCLLARRAPECRASGGASDLGRPAADPPDIDGLLESGPEVRGLPDIGGLLESGPSPVGLLGPGPFPVGPLSADAPKTLSSGGITWHRVGVADQKPSAPSLIEGAEYRAQFSGPTGSRVVASISADGSWAVRDKQGAAVRLLGETLAGRADPLVGHSVGGAAASVAAARETWRHREILRHHAARMRSPKASARMTSARLMKEAVAANTDRARSGRARTQARAASIKRMRKPMAR